MAQAQEDDLAEERNRMAADIEATIKELQALLATLPAEKVEPDAAEQADAANAVAETAEEPTVPEPEPVQQLETPAEPEEDKAATASKQEECTMADTPDFKKFYEETIPNEKNLQDLYSITKKNEFLHNKQLFLSTSNLAFAMLAHFNIKPTDEYEYDTIGRYLTEEEDSIFSYSLARLKIKAPTKITDIKAPFNPTAIPMIQRYRKMFDAYEKEHGLTPFYLQTPFHLQKKSK